MVANLSQSLSASGLSSLASGERALCIRVRGTVQGVGFRPMVYGLAQAHDLRGEVYNDGAGVVIWVAGTSAQVDG
ncbi:MAG TPA: acylphosphatase, partial [Candidatus Obscuribacterales bacterium]